MDPGVLEPLWSQVSGSWATAKSPASVPPGFTCNRTWPDAPGPPTEMPRGRLHAPGSAQRGADEGETHVGRLDQAGQREYIVITLEGGTS